MTETEKLVLRVFRYDIGSGTYRSVAAFAGLDPEVALSTLHALRGQHYVSADTPGGNYRSCQWSATHEGFRALTAATT